MTFIRSFLLLNNNSPLGCQLILSRIFAPLYLLSPPCFQVRVRVCPGYEGIHPELRMNGFVLIQNPKERPRRSVAPANEPTLKPDAEDPGDGNSRFILGRNFSPTVASACSRKMGSSMRVMFLTPHETPDFPPESYLPSGPNRGSFISSGIIQRHPLGKVLYSPLQFVDFHRKEDQHQQDEHETEQRER
jgi:hypothetical protein